MICPSYSVPLKYTDKSNRLGKPTVPDEIIGTHHEIASRVVGNGIYLWGVKLRGDSHMNIMSPCFNQTHCEEWVKAATHIFTERPRINADGHEGEQTLSEIGFHISDPYPELDGVKGRASVFPESLLLLGNTLTNLSLEKCGLTRLPFSIGHHLTNLQVSDYESCQHDLSLLSASVLLDHVPSIIACGNNTSRLTCQTIFCVSFLLRFASWYALRY